MNTFFVVALLLLIKVEFISTEVFEISIIEEADYNENIGEDFNITQETKNERNTTEAVINMEQISPIISQLLSPISTTLQPYLGPLAPLSNIIANVITEAVINLLNDTVSSTRRQEQDNFTTYLVNVPRKGRYLLISKHKIEP